MARPTVPAVDLDPGTDLDRARDQAVEAAVYLVSLGTLLNAVSDNPVDGIARLLNFHQNETLYATVVYPGEWTDAVIDAVLTLAAKLRPDPELDGLFVVSARDPPDSITYLTSVEHADTGDGATVTPVGQALTLFEAGAADDFVGLYQTTKHVIKR